MFFGLLYTPVELVLAVAINALSRRHEYQADRFAAETTGDGASLVGALKRLAVENLSNLTPHPMVVVLEASHPPVVRRIRALEAMPLRRRRRASAQRSRDAAQDLERSGRAHQLEIRCRGAPTRVPANPSAFTSIGPVAAARARDHQHPVAGHQQVVGAEAAAPAPRIELAGASSSR